MSFESVDFDVINVAFDFAFVLGGVGPRWDYGCVIRFREGEDLGVEFGIVPVGLFDCGFEVVDAESGRDAAEVPEGVLDGS